MNGLAILVIVLLISVCVLVPVVIYLATERRVLIDRIGTLEFCLNRLEKAQKATWASPRPTSSLLSAPLKGPTFQGGDAHALDR